MSRIGHAGKLALLAGFTFATLASLQSAMAGQSYDRYGDANGRYDSGSYNDRYDGSRYDGDRYDGRYGDDHYAGRHDDGRSDDGRYRDRDGYYGRTRYVCDPDGDRCYSSTSRTWNYREYYRRHGYRWND